jgi:hypothetical protein
LPFAGALLLEEVVNSLGGEGIDAIMDAARRRFSESQHEKAAGSTVWWRVSKECVHVYMLMVIELSCNRIWPKICSRFLRL